MNKQWTRLESWLLKHSLREQLMILFFGFAIIYVVWYFLFMRPVVIEQKNISKQISDTEIKIKNLQQKIDLILEVVAKTEFSQKLQMQSELSGQSLSASQHLKKLSQAPAILSSENSQQLLKDIISQQQGIVLVSIKTLPSEEWKPVQNAGLSEYSLFKKTFQIVFRSDFAETYNYLKRMEKLPWRLYWDSLEYKVLTYPNAEVILTFHILSNQKS